MYVAPLEKDLIIHVEEENPDLSQELIDNDSLFSDDDIIDINLDNSENRSSTSTIKSDQHHFESDGKVCVLLLLI